MSTFIINRDIKPSTVLVNATYYDGNKLVHNKDILINNGVIADIVDTGTYTNRYESKIFCDGQFVYPAFFDSHLHFPGRLLYETYGIMLSASSDIEGYKRIITEYKEKTSETVHKGYGWSVNIVDSIEKYTEISEFLNNTFSDECVILFSDDYHHAICNNKLKELIETEYSGIIVSEGNHITDNSIFKLIQSVGEITFSEEQFKDCILRFQSDLIACGICATQTLMFIGGDGNKEYAVLKELDTAAELHIDTFIACTAYQYETLDEIKSKYEKLKTYESRHVHLQCLKLYMDGVVDNHSAYLNENYSNKDTHGHCYWDTEKLQEVCNWADKEGIQIHVHTIGDAAVHTAVKALTQAMDINGTKGKTRHVLAHIQLADDADIKLMGDYGIIASMQPYWIDINGEYYDVDVNNIGDRVHTQYKMQTLLDNGVMVTGGSDSPVVEKPLAFEAMRNALLRENEHERVSVKELIDMFTINAAKQLGVDHKYGEIALCKSSSLLLLDKELTYDNIVNNDVHIECRIIID